MATCVSPVTIELSSDSENGTEDNAEILVGHRSFDNDVFTLDWADDNYTTPTCDEVDLDNEPDLENKCVSSPSSADTVIYALQCDNEIPNAEEHSPTNRSCSPKQSGAEKITVKEKEKLLKEQKRVEKQRLQEKKKLEDLKQKRIKAALAEKHKSLKPEENIKFLTINIDTNIVNSEYGGVVLTSLQQSGIRYAVESLVKPFTVCWLKETWDITVDEDGNIHESAGIKEENQLIYIMNYDKLVQLVDGNELLTHVQTIKSIYMDKNLILVIMGMQKYFNLLKNKMKKLHNAEGKAASRKINRKNNGNEEMIVITKDKLQHSLTEVQLIGKCNHLLIESGEELSSLIVSTTKSLAQLDYKLDKHSREEGELDWFAKADSKHCVKVDKNGNGLMKLWQQQICQFNLVGLDAATAITSNFNSPSDLINCYKKCQDASEAQLLLQNIQIRRNAGLLSTTRRVGPEISKKIYHFYTADDPDLEL